LSSDLSRRQRQILDVLYRLGEATANDIVTAIPADLANATVRTQLRILEEKGAVKRRLDGKRYVYRPAEPRKSAAATAFGKVLDVFFGGSVEDALATHLSNPKTRISDEELQRLRLLLQQHQSRGKSK
jgi:BlaI family transcriptional regulator, penicillinase repressor